MSARAELPGYLPTLDGWRAVAVLCVIACHAADAPFGPGGALAQPLLHRVTRLGAHGVDLFFAISGFLICHRLIEERAATGTISLRGFYWRRAFRILPAYFAYLLALVVLSLTVALPVNGAELVSCATFLRNYLPEQAALGPYTGHFWSLAVEEHFYALMPALLLVAGPRSSPWALLALAVAVSAWRFVEFRADLLGSALGGPNFYSRTDVRLDALLWGCVLAFVVGRPCARNALERALGTTGQLGVVVATLLCIWFAPPLALTWEALLMPLVIVGTCLVPGSWPGRALEAAPLRYVGRMSYSLYVWQSLFLVPRDAPRPGPLGLLQEWPFNLLAVALVAALSYHGVEKPILAWSRRRAAVTGPRPAGPAAEGTHG